jgi:carboxypeptidase C (cathepsin A)
MGRSARFFALLLSFYFLSTTTPVYADVVAGACTDAQKAQVTTRHNVVAGGTSIDYTVTTGFVEVTTKDNSAKACLFFTSYTADANGSDKPRPLTFAFNGGPGSASLWLHLGLLGPKRVDMGPKGLTAPVATALIENPDSPLNVTDVVMIDPVATGFSRADKTDNNNKFFGVTNDYVSIGAFVQSYLNTYNRWTSPKFILGESYGGIRGSLLANYLQSGLGIGVDGVVLISPAFSWNTLSFGNPDNNVPYWSFMPTFATTAWYHHKIAPQYQNLTVEEVYAQAKKFANTEYRDALDRGSELDATEIDHIAQTLSNWIGIPKQELIDVDLKINDSEFGGSLLASQHLDVGRYDSRDVGQKLRMRDGDWSAPSGFMLRRATAMAASGQLS